MLALDPRNSPEALKYSGQFSLLTRRFQPAKIDTFKRLKKIIKAWLIRRISAVLNSIQRIKCGRNLTSESAAAFLPHVRLVLSHYPTEIRHRLKRRIYLFTYAHMYVKDDLDKR